jgi:glycerol-3-phosphate acyltransferase PlsY
MLAVKTGIPGEVTRIILGLACICGHNWTVFLKFKGGKGVATTFGVLLGLAFKIAGLKLIFGLVILTWAAAFVITRMVSLASILSAVSIPGYMLLFKQSATMLLAGVLLAVFIIFRHHANLERIFQGKEPRTHFKKPA